MEETLFFIAKFVSVLLEVVSFAMIIRALMPIFIDVDGNRFYALTALITEPFVAPVRFLLEKFNIGQSSPIDWGFFATYLIIWLIQLFLPSI